jgi:16S rRNA (cytosine967-C5)-methyltransferase
VNERETAFLLLQRIELFGSYSSAVLTRQSSIVRELVRGVLRWRLRLDFVIAELSSRPLKKIDQRAVQILRIAIHELMFMSTAPYAVVNESVTLAAKHARRARGFVNAVLRKATTTDLIQVLPPAGPERVAVETAHPAWLLEKWRQLFGQARARSIADANQKKSTADLLVNTRSLSLDQAEELLRQKNVTFARSSLVDQMVRLEQSSTPVRSEIDQGLFHPMDEGSALVASVAGSGKGRVLDAAAAPGGKSLWLALSGHQVLSQDVSWSRLVALRKSFARFRISDASVTGDGGRPPFRSRFETVLLDAPCSGTGTLRKNPEIKWRLNPEGFSSFAETQRRLLAAALELSANECIYSTCSLEREENDDVVNGVLSSHPEFEIADLGPRLNEHARHWLDGRVLRLTPESGADGFTVFRLTRR